MWKHSACVNKSIRKWKSIKQASSTQTTLTVFAYSAKIESDPSSVLANKKCKPAFVPSR